MRDVERELRDRYARHYRVMCMRSPREVLVRLGELAAEGEQVALVLAGQRLSGMTESELLDQVRHLHPYAKRGLLLAWDSLGDRATGAAIFDSIARGRIDHYVVRPSEPSDEVFHQAISSLLLEWAEARCPAGTGGRATRSAGRTAPPARPRRARRRPWRVPPGRPPGWRTAAQHHGRNRYLRTWRCLACRHLTDLRSFTGSIAHRGRCRAGVTRPLHAAEGWSMRPNGRSRAGLYGGGGPRLWYGAWGLRQSPRLVRCMASRLR